MTEERNRSGVETALRSLGLDAETAREFMHDVSLTTLPAGREITLYRFTRGECCVLSADSILGHRLFPANARVEEDVEVALIPATSFNRWLGHSTAWRTFVLEALSRRLVGLVDTIDAVAFRRMDVRISGLLNNRSGGRQATVLMTHQAIADELGSSREVVSPVLEDLQARGMVRLSRGAVEVLAPSALERSAHV